MSDLVWPLDLRPASQEFYIQTLSTVWASPYTGQNQVLERDGARWVSRLTFQRGDPVARQVDALIASLRGPAGTVLVPDWRTPAARGTLAGTPQLAGGSGRSLTVTGFAPGATGVLLPGDLIQTSPGRAHLVTATVNAGPDGGATVPVEPRLREPVAVGPLVTTACRVRMRLSSDDAGRNPTGPPRRTEWSLELFEVLP
ncbi:hypothetical protein [Oleisolibacter albus]|uniref:hypothetical protein n=1 Tax=Oleisolibacter albus TaxID=2171757 RepID=UPI000DF3588B|nr:hypothetical protein [Oleisolibacter albus]